MPERYEYHYDGQIRRFLEQVIRAFSGFQWIDGAGNLQTVPARHALQNRQVANIMRNNSENTMLIAPLITVFVNGVRYDRERQQNPNFVSTLQVLERKVDSATNRYTNERGNAYTVQRYMPMPFELTVQVDIWTTNMEQKHQLFEQIMTTFAVGFDIQNSDNPLDWTALTTMYLDDIIWSSQSVPIGTESNIDVMTISFKLPIWLTPPAKLTQQRVIEQVTANVLDAEFPINESDWCGRDAEDKIHAGTLLARTIVTPGNHQVQVSGNTVTLLTEMGGLTDEDGAILEWRPLIDKYGVLQPAISQLRLSTSDDPEFMPTDLVGTIQYDPLHPNVLLWQIDPASLPANTLAPINGIINPMETYPGKGVPEPADGTRYLVLNDIGAPTRAWGNLSAVANDIIEFGGGTWTVAFNSRLASAPQHVLNLASTKQLRWTGADWLLAIEGDYRAGYWHLVL